MAQPEGPSGAMGFQPGARIWGGVARSELLKGAFFPVTHIGGGAAIGNIGFHTGALIDAVGEWCQIELAGSEGFTTLKLFGLWIERVAVLTTLMDFRFDWDMGSTGEAYNIHTNTTTTNVSCTQGQVRRVPLQTYPEAPTMITADDVLGLRVTYAAAGAGGGATATNWYVIGAYLSWF